MGWNLWRESCRRVPGFNPRTAFTNTTGRSFLPAAMICCSLRCMRPSLNPGSSKSDSASRFDVVNPVNAHALSPKSSMVFVSF